MPPLLDHLTEFDITTGLEYADNDEELYIEVLAMFYDQLINEFQTLPERLSQPDEVVARQVHTLKGSAGSVGASRIEAAASDIDMALKRGDSVSAEQARALDDAIQASMAQLRSVAQSAL